MQTEYLFAIVSFIVTWTLGIISKKYTKMSNKKIPIQNLIIGIIIAIIEFAITKDFNTAIAVSGLTAGGMYDIVNNLKKMEE